jgi:hypothetical protein
VIKASSVAKILLQFGSVLFAQFMVVPPGIFGGKGIGRFLFFYSYNNLGWDF